MKRFISAVTWMMIGPVWANESAQPPATPTAPEVKEQIILNNPANLQALKTLLGPDVPPAQAPQQPPKSEGAAPAVRKSSSESAAGRMTVQVRPGETLDRILARTLGSAPVAAAVVRQAVVEMNPSAFVGGSPHRLISGSTLTLPSPQELSALSQGTVQAASRMNPEPTKTVEASAAEDRRNWVRYP